MVLLPLGDGAASVGLGRGALNMVPLVVVAGAAMVAFADDIGADAFADAGMALVRLVGIDVVKVPLTREVEVTIDPLLVESGTGAVDTVSFTEADGTGAELLEVDAAGAPAKLAEPDVVVVLLNGAAIELVLATAGEIPLDIGIVPLGDVAGAGKAVPEPEPKGVGAAVEGNPTLVGAAETLAEEERNGIETSEPYPGTVIPSVSDEGAGPGGLMIGDENT